ncbi:MAG TPA: hypothetical protein VGR82_02695 [Methylomirabilota bacterium]|jgi:hypothetical protein|nr:hypothetical protein [Methylomirabilota bacterium]
MAALSSEVRALLDEPNFAHLVTLMPDGSPQEAQLRGRVVERRRDQELVTIDRISRKYTGKESPTRYAALPFAHTPPGR